MSELLQKILIGVAVALVGSAATVGWAVSQSDPPPWAGLRPMQAMFIQIYIRDSWKDYCAAEYDKNRSAALAASDDINVLELRYAALTGREIPLRPCP